MTAGANLNTDDRHHVEISESTTTDASKLQEFYLGQAWEAGHLGWWVDPD